MLDRLISRLRERTYGLPEGEKDDKLNAEDFQERSMLCNVMPQLVVELDKTVHGNSHRYCFECQDPDMSENRVQRSLAITVGCLADYRDDSEQDSDETVLEHTEP